MMVYKGLNEKATVEELGNYYLENHVKDFYAESTYKSYKSKMDKYVFPEIGISQVKQLKKLDVQNLIYSLNAEANTISPNTIKTIHFILRKVLNFAVDMELITKNVSNNVKLPRQVKYTPKIYSKDDVKILLIKSETSFLYVPVCFAVKIGLRRSEILALQWKDFDRNNRTLTVSKNITKSAKSFGNPKSQKSKRILKIPNSLFNLLITHYEKQKQFLREDGITQTADTFIVCKKDGRPYNPTFISRKFADFLAMSNLPAIRFHDLRHTYATHAHNDGMPLKHLSKSLGHVSAAATIDNYVHIQDRYSI